MPPVVQVLPHHSQRLLAIAAAGPCGSHPLAALLQVAVTACNGVIRLMAGVHCQYFQVTSTHVLTRTHVWLYSLVEYEYGTHS